MKPITILHTADIHCPDARLHPEWHRKAIASLTTLAETAEARKPDLVVIAGDLYHGGIQNSAAAGFPAFIAVIRRILDVCPIAAVSGTTTHDPAGAYDVLAEMEPGHGFTKIYPGKTYALYGCGYVSEMEEKEEDYDQLELLILGCPEPTREWVLAGMEGADTVDMAVALKDKMKGLFLGYGAFRAQYHDVPCVFIYHGAVQGASMQNGQVVGASEITIGREDLQLVGADYYALGHIHLDQEIPGLPQARYPGPGYPKEWGELGQAGFNLVAIAKNNAGPDSGWGGIPFCAEISRIDYPHPRRVKFSLDWPEPVGPEVEGVQAWVAYRATEEQEAKIDAAALLEAYIEQGALLGSRVTVDTIRTETVRAAEITERHGLAEKLKVYAGASGQPEPSVEILSKAAQLEREAEAQGYGGDSHHLRLRKARVRGHKAHVRRLKAEEVTLDLAKFGPGLIAMVGPNGYGKTSLGENAQFFPQEMSPGRDKRGGLRDSFCLRDSLREVWKDDPRTGEEFRALIEIDGANASGGVKAHLFRRPNAGADWAPLSNGKMESYLEEVTKLEGSLRMFLRSAFWTQEPSDNNPRIRRATKGEKKEIFAELAISVPYPVYAASAKEKADTLDDEIGAERGKLGVLAEQLAVLPEMGRERISKEDDLRSRALRLASIESDGKAAAAKVEQLQKALQAQKVAEAEIAGLRRENRKREQTIADALDRIGGYEAAVSRREEAQKIIAEEARLLGEEKVENERRSKIQEERLRLSTDFANRQKAHADDLRTLEASRGKLRTQKATLEGDQRVLQAAIDRLTTDVAVEINPECPECGQRAHSSMCSGIVKLARERAENEQKLAELRDKTAENEQKLAEIAKELAGIVDPKAPAPPDLPPLDEEPLQRVRRDLAALNVVGAQEDLKAAQEATAKTEELQEQIRTAREEIAKAETAAAKLEATVDAKLEEKFARAQAEHKDLQRRYTEAREEVAGVSQQLRDLSARIQDLEKQGADIEERKLALEAKDSDLREWRYLQEACGPDGIPALELDALGPAIAAEANKLLAVLKDYEIENHYDSIRFETTRMAGKGSKTRQIEDFTIYCHDAEHDAWVDMALISVGEAVWVDTAIMEAFGIIRERNSGRRSLTQWRDESDAALDPKSRRAYFAILQAGHDASGRYQTLVVTHSPEALEMIEQRIDIRELARAQESPAEALA